jgi:CHAD domain-containing protein
MSIAARTSPSGTRGGGWAERATVRCCSRRLAARARGPGRLAAGFKRIYRRGLRAYRKAFEEPSSDNLHELRKRVKDLWYSAQILRPVARKQMKRVARTAHRLSEMIGDEHDLALLGERAAERRDRFDDEAAADDLAERIERSKAELRSAALELGSRLYRKKPGKMVRRLGELRVSTRPVASGAAHDVGRTRAPGRTVLDEGAGSSLHRSLSV